jgi:hypothetical protein
LCCLALTHFKEVSLFPNGRRFALSDEPGYGVSCGPTGVFVGAVALLEPCRNCGGFRKWRPRPLDEINRDLSRRYGVPVEFGAKMQGLSGIANALDRGDLLHAHIATLHLEIPDPPALAKGAHSSIELVALAKDLHASGMLKRDWDPSKHPRWPVGSPDSTGGRFAPTDAELDAAPDESSASTRTAQAGTIPAPLDLVVPRRLPFPLPREIVPPLGIYPRRELVNPFPDDPEYEQEWAEALLHCYKLKTRKQLRRGDNRGSGTFEQCVRGRVTERCGGNPTA